MSDMENDIHRSEVKSDGDTQFWIGVGSKTKADWIRGSGMDMTLLFPLSQSLTPPPPMEPPQHLTLVSCPTMKNTTKIGVPYVPAIQCAILAAATTAESVCQDMDRTPG